MQKTSAPVEIESSAMTILQNSVADERVMPSSSGVNDVEVDEKQNSAMVVDDVSFKERNETEASKSHADDSIQTKGNVIISFTF